MKKNILRTTLIALNVVLIILFLFSFDAPPKNITEIFFSIFFFSIPLLTIYTFYLEYKYHKNQSELLQEQAKKINGYKIVSLILNAFIVFVIGTIAGKSFASFTKAAVVIYSLFIVIPAINLFAVCLDENLQWIGLHPDRTSWEEKRKFPYNKIAILAFCISLLEVFGLTLARPLSFLLAMIALAQIRKTQERGTALAIAAVFTWFILLEIVIPILLH